MYRKPEHYPKWLREILYDPFRNMRSIHPDTERNIKTLEWIYSNYGKYSSINDFIFDMSIEHERDVIRQQEIHEGIKETLRKYETRIAALEQKLNAKSKRKSK